MGHLNFIQVFLSWLSLAQMGYQLPRLNDIPVTMKIVMDTEWLKMLPAFHLNLNLLLEIN